MKLNREEAKKLKLLGAIEGPPVPSKYRNQRTVVDGIAFASRREALRYSELKILERAGRIENLTLQPKFPCVVNGQTVYNYRADFRYYDSWAGVWIVEDAKGFRTPVYRLVKKLVKACLGIDIQEV